MTIDPVHLPGPENPASLLLVAQHLGSPPPPVPGHRIGLLDVKLCTIFVCGRQTPLSDNGGRISSSVVGARVAHVRISVRRRSGAPLQVVMIIVQSVRQIYSFEPFVGIAASPQAVHHHDMQPVAVDDSEAVFQRTNPLPSVGIVTIEHALHGVVVLKGLVNELDASDVGEVRVGVRKVRQPLHELQSPLVLVILVESWTGSHLPSESLPRLLGSGRGMEVENYVQTRFSGVPAQIFQVLESTLRPELAVPVDQIFLDPVTQRNADGVQAHALDLRDVRLIYPRRPMLLERGVGRSLAQRAHAVEFARVVAAPHAPPLVPHHPWLHDEEASQIHSADRVVLRQPGARRPEEEARRDRQADGELARGHFGHADRCDFVGAQTPTPLGEERHCKYWKT
ncbi:hypothetical protein Mapa_004264 [Marchantia paleacea]|nr:hypothetical protein Mapa_004264 [Marchantia paleacea]